MQKIDRLGWAAGICFSAYGRRIGIRTDQPEALATIVDCLPAGWERNATPVVDHLYSLKVGGPGPRSNLRQYTLLYSGLTRLARTMNMNEALDALADDLEQYVALHAANRVFLHAGVVGWRGRAIVLPGRSFAGKSTLVAALLRAGATYYSDEFAVLDGQGRVHPFPRLLAMRKENGEPDGRCGPDQFSSRAGNDPLTVGLVVFLEYQKDHPGQWHPFSTARAALQLVQYAYCATAEPERAVFTIAKAVHNCTTWKGKRGEADATAAQLLQMVDTGRAAA